MNEQLNQEFEADSDRRSESAEVVSDTAASLNDLETEIFLEQHSELLDLLAGDPKNVVAKFSRLPASMVQNSFERVVSNYNIFDSIFDLEVFVDTFIEANRGRLVESEINFFENNFRIQTKNLLEMLAEVSASRLSSDLSSSILSARNSTFSFLTDQEWEDLVLSNFRRIDEIQLNWHIQELNTLDSTIRTAYINIENFEFNQNTTIEEVVDYVARAQSQNFILNSENAFVVLRDRYLEVFQQDPELILLILRAYSYTNSISGESNTDTTEDITNIHNYLSDLISNNNIQNRSLVFDGLNAYCITFLLSGRRRFEDLLSVYEHFGFIETRPNNDYYGYVEFEFTDKLEQLPQGLNELIKSSIRVFLNANVNRNSGDLINPPGITWQEIESQLVEVGYDLSNPKAILPDIIAEKRDHDKCMTIIEDLKLTYGIDEIIYPSFDYNEVIGGLYVKSISYSELLSLLVLFSIELLKYPPQFLRNINLNKVIFGFGEVDFAHTEAILGGYADIDSNSIALVLSGSSTEYDISVLHHELGHIFHSHIIESIREDAELANLNLDDFDRYNDEYGHFGHLELPSQDVDIEGHADLYGRTNTTEDFATIYEKLIVSPETYNEIMTRAESDEILRAKIELIKVRLEELSEGLMNSQYWADFAAGRVDKNYWR